MSQNDLSIANQGFASFRSDLNSALQALGSTNSGTSAPSTTYANQLFYDTTNNILKIRNEDNDAFISLFTLDQANDNIESLAINGALSCEGFTSNGIDDNADAVAITIDSSENVLVGRTSTISGGSNSSSGAQIGSNGLIQSAVSGDTAISLQRLSGDGDIIQLRKDTTLIGKLGSNSGTNLIIGTGDTGVYFNSGSDAVHPWNVSSGSGATRDNAIDLGRSGDRFKDLYLGGGLYVGGTGSANHLDDYEEGTWTPVVAGNSSSGSASYSIQNGDYVKIGKMVYIRARVGYSSGTGSGDLIINGLPFSSPSSKYAFLGLSFRDGLTISSGKTAYAFVSPSSTTVTLIEIGTGTSATDGVAYDSAVTDLSFSGFYLSA